MDKDNPRQEGELEEQELVVSDVLKQLTGEDTLTIYGYCPGCKEIHCDIQRLRGYFQFLSDLSMINWN